MSKKWLITFKPSPPPPPPPPPQPSPKPKPIIPPKPHQSPQSWTGDIMPSLSDFHLKEIAENYPKFRPIIEILKTKIPVVIIPESNWGSYSTKLHYINEALANLIKYHEIWFVKIHTITKMWLKEVENYIKKVEDYELKNNVSIPLNKVHIYCIKNRLSGMYDKLRQVYFNEFDLNLKPPYTYHYIFLERLFDSLQVFRDTDDDLLLDFRRKVIKRISAIKQCLQRLKDIFEPFKTEFFYEKYERLFNRIQKNIDYFKDYYDTSSSSSSSSTTSL